MINLVIDTNIIIRDWRMEGSAFQVVLWFLNKTGSKLYVPNIVIEEVINKEVAPIYWTVWRRS